MLARLLRFSVRRAMYFAVVAVARDVLLAVGEVCWACILMGLGTVNTCYGVRKGGSRECLSWYCGRWYAGVSALVVTRLGVLYPR